MARDMYSVESHICTHEELDSSNSNHESDCEITHPVFLNEVVLDCIFQFLDLTDLKHCRSVCEKWNRVSEVTFKKKGRVCFYFLKNDAKEVGSSVSISKYPAPIDLTEYFRHSQQKVKISSLGLSNRLPWSPSKLAEFFATEGKFITNLKFYDVILPVAENDRNSFHENYDLISLIGNNLRLKYLELTSCSSNNTCFTISLNDLSNISHIWLAMCKIELKDDTKISPVNLTLHRISLSRGTEKIGKICINDFIDFRAMKNLILLNGGFTKLSLDFTGSVKLDYLYMQEIDILNFERSSWNINSLNLNASCIQTKSNMKFNNLSIDNTRLALNSLPLSLKSLRLSINVDIVEGNLWNISLPHVTELALSRNDIINLSLPNLINCFTMLTELSMYFGETNNITVDTNMIPRTVKKMSFSGGHNIDLIGEEVLQLERVFVMSHDFQLANKIAKHFAPISLSVSIIKAMSDDSLVDLFELLSLFRTNIPHMTFFVSRKILEDLKNLQIFHDTQRCFFKNSGTQIELVNNFDALLNSKIPCSKIKVYYDCVIPQEFGTRFVRTTDGKKVYY